MKASFQWLFGIFILFVFFNKDCVCLDIFKVMWTVLFGQKTNPENSVEKIVFIKSVSKGRKGGNIPQIILRMCTMLTVMPDTSAFLTHPLFT